MESDTKSGNKNTEGEELLLFFFVPPLPRVGPRPQNSTQIGRPGWGWSPGPAPLQTSGKPLKVSDLSFCICTMESLLLTRGWL